MFRLENRTGYDTGDLVRFVRAGLKATRTPSEGLRVVFTSSPIRSRGCATVGSKKQGYGKQIIIAIAPPWRFSLRRLGRLFEHEAGHLHGLEHEDMSRLSRALLNSHGRVPAWARGLAPRWRRRAPAQLPFLRGNSVPGFQRDPDRATRVALDAENHASELTLAIYRHGHAQPGGARPRDWQKVADALEVAADAWRMAGDEMRAKTVDKRLHDLLVEMRSAYMVRESAEGGLWTRTRTRAK